MFTVKNRNGSDFERNVSPLSLDAGSALDTGHLLRPSAAVRSRDKAHTCHSFLFSIRHCHVENQKNGIRTCSRTQKRDTDPNPDALLSVKRASDGYNCWIEMSQTENTIKTYTPQQLEFIKSTGWSIFFFFPSPRMVFPVWYTPWGDETPAITAYEQPGQRSTTPFKITPPAQASY